MSRLHNPTAREILARHLQLKQHFQTEKEVIVAIVATKLRTEIQPVPNREAEVLQQLLYVQWPVQDEKLSQLQMLRAHLPRHRYRQPWLNENLRKPYCIELLM